MYIKSKKIFSIILALILSLSIFILPVSATDAVNNDDTTKVITTEVSFETNKTNKLEETSNEKETAKDESIKEKEEAIDFSKLKIEAPDHFVYSVLSNNSYDMFCITNFVSEDIAEIMEKKEMIKDKKITIYTQTDWRVNGGSWNYKENWETYPTQGFGFEVKEIVSRDEILSTYTQFICGLLGMEFSKENHFDFSSNVLEMKSRYYIQVITNAGTEDETVEHYTSDWSEVKEVTDSDEYDTSKIGSTFKLNDDNLFYDNTLKEDPYFTFSIDWTPEYKDAIVNILGKNSRYVSLVCEKQVGNGKWTESNDLNKDVVPYKYGEYTINIPVTEIMSDTPIRYRVSLFYGSDINDENNPIKVTSEETLVYDYLELSKTETNNNVDTPITEENNSSITFVIIGIIVLLLVVGIIVVIIIKKKKENEN